MYVKIVAFLSVFFFTGCFFNQDIYLPQPSSKSQEVGQKPKQEKSIEIKKQDSSFYQQSDNWVGYYYGVLPCANCAGVETWLHLDKRDAKGVYELSENYLQMSDGVFKTDGDLEWQDDLVAKMIAKDETRYVFLGKDLVTFINAPNEALQNEYALKKLDSFVGYGQHLLVLPQSVQKGKIDNQKAIQLNALMNFEYTNESGHNSLKASYIVKCQTDTYSIPKIVYFKKRFATGKHKEMPQGKTAHFRGEDDVLRQAQKRYCR